MATHRQLPNNTDIAPFQEKGRWYRAFIEKDESGNAKLTYKDEGLPEIAPTGYGFTMDGQKDGKDFHLISVSCNPDVGTGTAEDPAFYYPTIGQNYTDGGSQFVVDFNHHESNVGIKLNGNALTPETVVNGINQKNTDFDIKALESITVTPTLEKVTDASQEAFTANVTNNNGAANIELMLSLANGTDSSGSVKTSLITSGNITADNVYSQLTAWHNDLIEPVCIVLALSNGLTILPFYEITSSRYTASSTGITFSTTANYAQLLITTTLLYFNVTNTSLKILLSSLTTQYSGDNLSTIDNITINNDAVDLISSTLYIVLVGVQIPYNV